MGMYTEIYFRAELWRDVPNQVVEMLEVMTGERELTDETVLPDHELFRTSRWDMLGTGGSAYFPDSANSFVRRGGTYSTNVLLHADLKNYGGEIGKFFDWIDEYVDGPEGKFMGYSLYEENDVPTLYQKKSDYRWVRRTP